MLEKPDIKDARIIHCLQTEYGLGIDKIVFLPLGADLNTAVYRAETNDDTLYFVKLRRGDFYEASVAVPNYLYDLGIKQIIPSLPTQSGKLWANLGSHKMILYPFVKGRNGFEVNLSDQQRIELGAVLKKFHTADIPAIIIKNVRRETFSAKWREKVKSFLLQIENEVFDDPIALKLVIFLKNKRDETLELVKRTDHLATVLQAQAMEFILCHGDIHGWNLLIDANNSLYIVDWDTLIFAPKERDLMFVGSGLGGNGHTLQEEEDLFYQGYGRPLKDGQTQINPIALAYYRYERIIEDIAISCEQIFLSNEGGEDRKQSLENLKSNFRPTGTIEIARQSDETVRDI